jgi:hypothetical protein
MMEVMLFQKSGDFPETSNKVFEKKKEAEKNKKEDMKDLQDCTRYIKEGNMLKEEHLLLKKESKRNLKKS